ncbi:MAG TPA: WYL domain-containing protein, partial [Ktedonobacteraceae bacterium]
RTFRLDRIQNVQVLAETFEKASDFDYETFVRQKYDTRGTTQVEIEFQADLATVQQKISTLYGTLTSTPTGTLYQEQSDDLEIMARYFMALNLPFVVHQPAELRATLRRLGERMIQIANIQP